MSTFRVRKYIDLELSDSKFLKLFLQRPGGIIDIFGPPLFVFVQQTYKPGRGLYMVTAMGPQAVGRVHTKAIVGIMGADFWAIIKSSCDRDAFDSAARRREQQR